MQISKVSVWSSVTPTSTVKNDPASARSQLMSSVAAALGENQRQMQANTAKTLHSATQPSASSSSKAAARERLEMLKDQVRMLRQMMIGMTPQQKKSMAVLLRSLAQELKQIAKQLGSSEGGGDDSASTASTPNASAGNKATDPAAPASEAQSDAAPAAEASTQDAGANQGAGTGDEQKAAATGTAEAEQAQAAAGGTQAAGNPDGRDDRFGEVRSDFSLHLRAARGDKLELDPEDAKKLKEVMEELKQLVRQVRSVDRNDPDAKRADEILASLNQDLGDQPATISLQV